MLTKYINGMENGKLLFENVYHTKQAIAIETYSHITNKKN